MFHRSNESSSTLSHNFASIFLKLQKTNFSLGAYIFIEHLCTPSFQVFSPNEEELLCESNLTIILTIPLTMILLLMNCFCGIFDRQNAFSLISSLDHVWDFRHCKPLTRCKQELNLRRASVQALLNEVS